MREVREELHLEVQLSEPPEITPVQRGSVDLCKLSSGSSRWRGELGTHCYSKERLGRMSPGTWSKQCQSETGTRDPIVSPPAINLCISGPSHDRGLAQACLPRRAPPGSLLDSAWLWHFLDKLMV